ncbi:glucosaminidase domain-containing protein [Candidatus Woesebacteria bacterium]|nr:glucosaminidase domain-containing protein [Candidatus Woesebacteria bacterium]
MVLFLEEPKQPTEVKTSSSETAFDIDKLAYAVAMSETHNCTKGYGLTYNNCFGIKNGNTAPCPKIGRNNMCIYEKPEESYAAFKTIWSKWYQGYPTLKSAQKWSGGSGENWLKNVKFHYDNN